MRTLFLLNPTAGKADCTRALPRQIDAAAAQAGLATGEYTIRTTAHAGHARELANAAARQARQAGEQLRIYTAGGDGTFNEALTGVYGFENAAVVCIRSMATGPPASWASRSRNSAFVPNVRRKSLPLP